MQRGYALYLLSSDLSYRLCLINVVWIKEFIIMTDIYYHTFNSQLRVWLFNFYLIFLFKIYFLIIWLIKAYLKYGYSDIFTVISLSYCPQWTYQSSYNHGLSFYLLLHYKYYVLSQLSIIIIFSTIEQVKDNIATTF